MARISYESPKQDQVLRGHFDPCNEKFTFVATDNRRLQDVIKMFYEWLTYKQAPVEVATFFRVIEDHLVSCLCLIGQLDDSFSWIPATVLSVPHPRLCACRPPVDVQAGEPLTEMSVK